MARSTFRFHHVGIVTRGLNACCELYVDLGYEPSQVFEDPIQNAHIVLLRRADGPMVEIISPMAEDSPAMTWAKRIDAGPYHTCYEVPDLKQAAESLEGHKVFPVTDAAPAVAFEMRRVMFLWGRRTGLLELLEEAP